MKKVIIAEDIYTLIEKEQSFLKRSDIRTFRAATNEKALALHKVQKADLIVAKLDTTEMSGETLCSLIRDDSRLSKVSIIIICSDAEADHERCLLCRANAYVSSPVNNAVLLQEMYQLLHIPPRRSLRVPVGIEIQGKSKKTPFTGNMENLSSSGMLLLSSAGFCEGDAITCSFVLPGSTNITVSAEVVRILERENEGGNRQYGIKFTDLDADTSSVIEAFIRNLP